MKIKVTENHIWNGWRDDCAKCPIALAVAELFPGKKIDVGHTIVRVWDGQRLLKDAALPQEAQGFIHDFDDGENVQPFEFELDI